MSKIFNVTLQWISSDYGGRLKTPVPGLRPTIRWQKFVEEWIAGAWDAEILELNFEKKTMTGTAKLKVSKKGVSKKEMMQKDALIELLDGYRVIAVGKIM